MTPCPGFRKTITLNFDEHRLLKAFVQGHIQVIMEDAEKGESKPIDEQVLPVFESIFLKLTAPSMVLEPGKN